MEKNTDQDLLFGVFALQLERITQEQMSKAYAEWLSRQDRSMASLLVERGWVSEDDRREIEQLIESQQQTQTGRIHETSSGTMSTELLEGLPDELTSQLTEALTVFTTSQESRPTPTETVELSSVLQPIDDRDRYSLLRIQGEGG